MDAPGPDHSIPTGSGPARSRRRCVGAARGGAAAAAAIRPAAITWGSASTTGRQREMEDAVAVVPDLLPGYGCDSVGGCVTGGTVVPPAPALAAATVDCGTDDDRPAAAAAAAAPSSSSSSSPAVVASSSSAGARFFAVYDGHGGSQVANYCARRIHEAVLEEWLRADAAAGWQRRWEAAFVHAFDRVDREILPAAVATDLVGSTALAVVLSACQIIVSNCGDSRAILCRGADQVIQLTVDHKPDNATELARIEAGGGRVFYWDGPRVSGILAMSRAIGDRYLRPFVIPVPDVFFTARTEEDECLVMATDGLWDVMSNKDVGEVACRLLRRQHRNGVVSEEAQPPAQVVADYLMNMALHKSSPDNISVIVVDLKSRSRRRSRT